MCTLIVTYSVTERGTRLWLGANRDEALTRASTLPTVDKYGETAIFAPRDSLAGGSWLGLNEYGVIVAITNRFGLDKRPFHRSRGLIVLDALEESSALAAADRIAATRADAHNGFHLLVADLNHVFLVWNDGQHLHREQLMPGAYVLTERSLGAGDSERLGWLADKLEGLQDRGKSVESELVKLLQYQNEHAPLEGTCIRMPGGIYGTRSSSIVSLEPGELRFLHAEGAPCVTPYVDFSRDARRVFSGY